MHFISERVFQLEKKTLLLFLNSITSTPENLSYIKFFMNIRSYFSSLRDPQRFFKFLTAGIDVTFYLFRSRRYNLGVFVLSRLYFSSLDSLICKDSNLPCSLFISLFMKLNFRKIFFRFMFHGFHNSHRLFNRI